MLKIVTFLAILFTSGAMAAHAMFQPVINSLEEAEAVIQEYRQSAVVGYVRMDDMGQLYYEEKQP